ncbi:MAG: DNA replication complex GINS family protein [Caldisphaeraceae archaeon]|nr:DNA replication complex GINS family protein [Caldisphaeraceae archaeon]
MKFEERLRLLNLDSRLRRTRVLLLRDYNSLPMPGGVMSVRKGDEIEVPRWEAEFLKERGVAEIKEEGIDIDYINNYHFREKRNSAPNQLTSLPQDFYLKIRSFIKKLDEAISKSPSHMLINDREAAEKNFLELSDVRLIKIIRLSQTDGDELKDRMTPEELLLYTTMKEIVKSWKEYVQSLIKGGGEAL